MEINNKQLLIFLGSSFIISAGLIAHGVFFDMNLSQISRIKYDGLFVTAIICFVSLVYLSNILNIPLNKKVDKIESRLNKLDNKIDFNYMSKPIKKNKFIFPSFLIFGLISLFLVFLTFVLKSSILKILSLSILLIIIFIGLILKGDLIKL